MGRIERHDQAGIIAAALKGHRNGKGGELLRRGHLKLRKAEGEVQAGLGNADLAGRFGDDPVDRNGPRPVFDQIA